MGTNPTKGPKLIIWSIFHKHCLNVEESKQGEGRGSARVDLGFHRGCTNLLFD